MIDVQDRLALGVKLASAVMHLHSSEWLSECWGKTDIYFLRKLIRRQKFNGKVKSIPEPVFEKPLIRRSFGLSKTMLTPGTSTTLKNCDKSIFSLGVVLVELCLQQRIDNLRNPQNGNTQPSDDEKYKIIKDRYGEITEIAGTEYSRAVWYCISGKNLPMTMAGARNLDSTEFKNSFYINVVDPLEKNYEVCDCDPNRIRR